MENSIIEKIEDVISKITNLKSVTSYLYRKGHLLYSNGQTQMLTQSKDLFDYSVDDEFNDFRLQISVNEDVNFSCSCESKELCHHAIAAFFQLRDDLQSRQNEPEPIGKAYTRQGMIVRVLEERKLKAKVAKYRINFADNIFGEHILINEKNNKYKITFRDFEKQTGYCSCPDFKTNKLGTCKHLMYAFDFVEKQSILKKRKFSKKYPFIEIYLDPLNDYKITWYYPEKPEDEIHQLIFRFFGKSKFLAENKVAHFLNFLYEAEIYKQIMIRPEVRKKIEQEYNQLALKKIVEGSNFNNAIQGVLKNIELFPYQIEGVEFASFKEGAIIADEMGLGKTIQAIATALVKKNLFHFSKTLIICPASLKDQWKREIEKYSDEKALIVDGLPDERHKIYKSAKEYFLIINYETVLRDVVELNKSNIDFIILDEAQRIKNYETLTAQSIKAINKKHALVITGTPIENRLIDLYSIVDFVDNNYLAPLWEFSYQYCYFDQNTKNKITGYYNLDNLKERISSILVRREKSQVIDQLPNISQIDIPVEMHELQADYHASFTRGIASILAKKIKTPFDMQRLMLLLSKMRMVCDSTYLIDLKTNFSPKLTELEHVLLEKLNIKNSNKKILIFSEWKRMTNIIGQMLKKNNIGFVELNGSVPVKNRGKIIKEFEDNENCKIFISTEAGGTGLNLQVADTVINFELPWNPAKKNQRIGRIDRLGQLSKNLTVISFITKKSIEMSIASGLILKQNLFDSVLSPDNETNIVDFSASGKAQFLKQIEEILFGLEFDKNEVFESEELEIDLEKYEKAGFIESDFEPEQIEAENEEIEEDEKVTEEKNIREINQEKTEQKAGQTDVPQTEKQNNESKVVELESVMNQGLAFFSGLFKVSTGKEISMEGKGIEIDRTTGEVTMKFKIPI